MSNAKNWCFTLNNYTADDLEFYDNLCEKIPLEISYLVIGKEIGESGTIHLQGFIQLVKKKRFAQVKILLGGRCHLESMLPNSTAFAASTYCKKDNDYKEWGQLQNKGINWNFIQLFITQ